MIKYNNDIALLKDEKYYIKKKATTIIRNVPGKQNPINPGEEYYVSSLEPEKIIVGFRGSINPPTDMGDNPSLDPTREIIVDQ